MALFWSLSALRIVREWFGFFLSTKPARRSHLSRCGHHQVSQSAQMAGAALKLDSHPCRSLAPSLSLASRPSSSAPTIARLVCASADSPQQKKAVFRQTASLTLK